MQTLLFAACLALAQVPTAPPAKEAQAPATVPLSFHSESFPFQWDRTIPLSIQVDGLKISKIFFNKRMIQGGVLGMLKTTEFGTRAQVEVTNTSTLPRVPGFAVAVLDRDGRLLGVASGGTKLGTLSPGETETFDLNFTQVKERLASGATFILAVELRN